MENSQAYQEENLRKPAVQADALEEVLEKQESMTKTESMGGKESSKYSEYTESEHHQNEQAEAD
jgi:hypothetical protein